MNNLENSSNNTADNAGEDKTFTQEEVNKIVQDRLARERNKTPLETEKALEEREKVIAAKEREIAFKAVMKTKGIPEEVYEALNCTSEDTFNKSLEILSPYIQKSKEPIFNAIGPTGGLMGNDSIRLAMGLK